MSRNEVLVVGWYGTETVGDKAILWGVLDLLRERFPGCYVTISSLYPFVTRRTVEELELDHVGIVETYSRDFEAACARCSAVVVGGGPLMDLEELNHIQYAFLAAHRRGVPRIVLGCGIGPLRVERYRSAVNSILRLGSEIAVRDTASAVEARRLAQVDAQVTGDPAGRYLRNLIDTRKLDLTPKNKHISFFIRHIPDQYLAVSPSDADEIRAAVDTAIVEFCLHLLEADWSLRFVPMHTFTVGDDDRIYARQIVRKIRDAQLRPISPDRLVADGVTQRPAEVVETMKESGLNICMRYHSVYFASELGCNFAAIDYTRGGKIQGYLSDAGKMDRLISLEQLCSRGSAAFADYL